MNDTVRFLELIERHGDLHLAEGQPAEMPKWYAFLTGAGLISRDCSLEYAGFWRLTEGRRLITKTLEESA